MNEDFETIPKEDILRFILHVEEYLSKFPQSEVPVNHYYSKGVYAREMVVPEGIILTGEIHRFENMNILLQGEVSVLSVDGYKRLKAPAIYTAQPGSKRLFKTHSEVKWVTILGTDIKDPELIREEFTTKDIKEIEGVICPLLS